jgi:hypothetical protein
MQDAYYSDIYELATGKKVLGFIFIVFEDEYPYVTAQMELPPADRMRGRVKYRHALARYAECKKSGVWPGHGDDLKTIQQPRWATQE